MLLIPFAILCLIELICPFFAKTYGIDGHYHIIWIRQFGDLIFHGDWLPRWVPSGYWGFGASTFYFYPPLTYYLSSLVRLVTTSTDPYFLYQMTGLVGTVASFFTARTLIYTLKGQGLQANVGAALYAVAPFRLAELYSRSSLSSHVAYTFIPLVWAGIIVLQEGKERKRGVLLLSISTALLVYSSVPLTLLTAVCILCAALVSYQSLRLSSLPPLLLAGAICCGLIAMQVSSIVSATPFAQLNELTATNQEFVLTDLLQGVNLPAVYHLAVIYIAVFLAFWAYHKTKSSERSSEESSLIRISIAITILLIFLEIPQISLWTWHHVPPFPLIQGGWRFYTQLVLFGAALVGIARTPLVMKAAGAILGLWTLSALLPAVLIATNLHIFAHGQETPNEPGEYLPRYTPVTYHHFEILERHESDPAVLGALPPYSVLSISGPFAFAPEFQAHLVDATPVTFHRFYWPLWHLYRGERELSTRPDSIGRATAILPQGDYVLSWRLKRTPLESLGIYLTALTAACLLCWWMWEQSRKRRPHVQRELI